MHITIVSPDLYEQNSDLLTKMHRLRASVFGSRMGWDVKIVGGEERDRYDGLGPTYILAVNTDGQVAGCARLLAASGPTMLQDNFPQLLVDGSLTAHAGMVESSRFCVDTSLEAGRGGGQLHLATLTMFAGIIEWSMANGYNEIVTATDLRFERILKRAGWPMTRLGAPAQIGKTIAIAGSLVADQASLESVRPPGYRSVITVTSDASDRSAA
ncbi:acyl-homoserine-lactone synthase TraI [Phyllobacterium zundukense]|uniref:Acyl-homoserine-lactone synthase n=1 Tax=Phyllobacterium zundukense TaxID=1867719 RepID=A0A2N9VT61_9HYPH|nr:acyl-homoserine-lactone synthase TraI [Phyllobacterium zundukense]ATU95407.1 autoinducer synthesis protein [Phyllobacterium zundukense]PIO42679.1 autoinducer synthesis protein [Phyllobacterium zundukense]